MGYKFKIEHRKISEFGQADRLSRLLLRLEVIFYLKDLGINQTIYAIQLEALGNMTVSVEQIAAAIVKGPLLVQLR